MLVLMGKLLGDSSFGGSAVVMKRLVYRYPRGYRFIKIYGTCLELQRKTSLLKYGVASTRLKPVHYSQLFSQSAHVQSIAPPIQINRRLTPQPLHDVEYRPALDEDFFCRISTARAARPVYLADSTGMAARPASVSTVRRVMRPRKDWNACVDYTWKMCSMPPKRSVQKKTLKIKKK